MAQLGLVFTPIKIIFNAPICIKLEVLEGYWSENSSFTHNIDQKAIQNVFSTVWHLISVKTSILSQLLSSASIKFSDTTPLWHLCPRRHIQPKPCLTRKSISTSIISTMKHTYSCHRLQLPFYTQQIKHIGKYTSHTCIQVVYVTVKSYERQMSGASTDWSAVCFVSLETSKEQPIIFLSLTRPAVNIAVNKIDI